MIKIVTSYGRDTGLFATAFAIKTNVTQCDASIHQLSLSVDDIVKNRQQCDSLYRYAVSCIEQDKEHQADCQAILVRKFQEPTSIGGGHDFDHYLASADNYFSRAVADKLTVDQLTKRLKKDASHLYERYIDNLKRSQAVLSTPELISFARVAGLMLSIARPPQQAEKGKKEGADAVVLIKVSDYRYHLFLENQLAKTSSTTSHFFVLARSMPSIQQRQQMLSKADNVLDAGIQKATSALATLEIAHTHSAEKIAIDDMQLSRLQEEEAQLASVIGTLSDHSEQDNLLTAFFSGHVLRNIRERHEQQGVEAKQIAGASAATLAKESLAKQRKQLEASQKNLEESGAEITTRMERLHHKKTETKQSLEASEVELLERSSHLREQEAAKEKHHDAFRQAEHALSGHTRQEADAMAANRIQQAEDARLLAAWDQCMQQFIAACEEEARRQAAASRPQNTGDGGCSIS